jgi:hypothetical protein
MTSQDPSICPHRNHPSTIQNQRMDTLSSLSFLSDWPTDIIRIVTHYMSIQLWFAFEEEGSSLMVLNLTSLQDEMKNNTFRYVSVPLTSNKSSAQPSLRKGESPIPRSIAEKDDCVMEARSEWRLWRKHADRSRRLATYAIINNILVRFPFIEPTCLTLYAPRIIVYRRWPSKARCY